MLSNTCKYAIRSVIYLSINAKDGKKIGIKKISEELEIPTPFLGKILQSLARQKLLTSTKGPHGGFGMGKEPTEITLMNIVEIVDGLDMFENCLIGMRPCKSGSSKQPPCPVHNQFGSIRQQIYDLFKGKTIGQLISEMESSDEYISL
ncbi:Rrf2 family transcriptional regulator [Marinifilum sp. N1E240]|jgi:Rrf2 family protein|uniref:RrF2 family transcriptional regulator n=1 Tax=Marinifilum sp. N1E240 TaxID=2608082 RepID=UPI00128D21FE|nr:Rrf2 family transcriptional regulator [Marinifilum sp. N1E240]MPQ48481.1 Rrf2 family transcriptional regulator [Marinifilum sp. N1E240]